MHQPIKKGEGLIFIQEQNVRRTRGVSQYMKRRSNGVDRIYHDPERGMIIIATPPKWSPELRYVAGPFGPPIESP